MAEHANNALIAAAKRGGQSGVLQALKLSADIHAQDDQALCRAADSGHVTTVALLLDHGADIHAQNDWVLCLAAANGHREVVALLLDRGADIHAADERALRWAAGRGYSDIVALLLDRGANIHAANDRALCMAASYGRREVVALLLDRGADIHARNDWALCLAAMKGHHEVVKVLLGYGADTISLTGKATIADVLPEITEEAAMEFSRKPSYSQCFRDTSKDRLAKHVFYSCLTGQFTTLVAAPLIASIGPDDRRLFQDVWDALPLHWKNRYQNLYLQFVKEGGIKPVIGPYSRVARQRDSEIMDSPHPD